jgi:curli biogenesis system outer membrane secretion channel CsgG
MIPAFVRFSARVLVAGSLSVALAGLTTGCASSEEKAQADTLTANVGKYDPPPKNAAKPRIGVPPFNVSTGQGFNAGKDLNDLAADQMTTLLDQSDRFVVIERTQLQQLVKEQNLEGIVLPGEMAKPAQVRGVDYLLLGKVTNLRVKKEDKSRGFGLAQIGGSFFNAGGADVKKTDIVITTECGVDIRLVDPTTGQILRGCSNFSEYKKTDSAGAMGVTILGANANADANIDLSEDDKGKILRLALDDALRKTLPKFDKALTSGGVKTSGAAEVPSLPAPAGNAAVPAAVQPVESPKTGTVAGKKFCPECGKEVAAGTKFCPNCGAKMP